MASRSRRLNDEVITGKREKEGGGEEGRRKTSPKSGWGLGKNSPAFPLLSLSLSSSPYSPSDTLTPLLQAQPDFETQSFGFHLTSNSVKNSLTRSNKTSSLPSLLLLHLLPQPTLPTWLPLKESLPHSQPLSRTPSVLKHPKKLQVVESLFVCATQI